MKIPGWAYKLPGVQWLILKVAEKRLVALLVSMGISPEDPIVAKIIEFFKGIFNPDTALERLIRGLIVGLATYLGATGMLPPEIAGPLAGVGLLIPAGEKNPVPPAP